MFLLFIIEVLALFLVNSNNPETSVAKSTLNCGRGLFFMSASWNDSNNMIFSHCNTNITMGTSPKNVVLTPERDFYCGTPLETTLG